MADPKKEKGEKSGGGRLSSPRFRLATLAVVLTLAMAALYLFQPPVLRGFMRSMEDRLVDLRFHLRGVEKPQTPVVLAVLDEKSLKKVGRWPWPRPVMAQFVSALGQSGAAVVGLDVGFFEPESSLALKYLEEERAAVGELSPAGQNLLERFKRRLSGDALLAEAIRDTASPMIVGYFLHTSRDEVGFIDDAEREARQRAYAEGRYRMVTLPEGVKEGNLPIPQAYAVEANVKQINDVAKFLGYFNMLPDPDGIIRGVPLAMSMKAKPLPGQPEGVENFDYFMPLTISMLRAYNGRELWGKQYQVNMGRLMVEAALAQGKASQAEADAAFDQLNQIEQQIAASWNTYEPRLDMGPAGVRRVTLGERAIDTEPSGELRLNFRGPGKTFPYYSWSDIMDGSLPPDALKDKLVVVGSSAVGVGDVRATPFDPMMPGPEVHATALDNIISGQWLMRPDWARGANLLIILLMGLWAAVVLPRVSAKVGGIYFVVMLAAYLGFNHFYAFEQNRWVLSAFFPIATLVILFIFVTVGRFILEERERRKTRRAFSYYLSEDVIEQVLKDPSKLQLGGQRRELSIFFSDLESFTSLSEGLDPVELTSLLNDYLSDMTDIIMDEGGTLDKYEGDAIIAFWNAPLDQPDHAMRAVRASLRCQQRLAERRPEFRERVGRDLRMRIGLNTGPVVVGNMGSAKRFDYTFLGDAGNLAARLEGANKVFGTYLMCSENTWSRLDGQVAGRELGSLVVVGKKQAVRVFEPLHLTSMEGPEPSPDFLKGLELVYAGRVEEAMAAFEACGDEAAAQSYIRRCQQIMAEEGGQLGRHLEPHQQVGAGQQRINERPAGSCMVQPGAFYRAWCQAGFRAITYPKLSQRPPSTSMAFGSSSAFCGRKGRGPRTRATTGWRPGRNPPRLWRTRPVSRRLWSGLCFCSIPSRDTRAAHIGLKISR